MLIIDILSRLTVLPAFYNFELDLLQTYHEISEYIEAQFLI